MPLILIPLVIIGVIMLLMIPFMLIYMVFRFLAIPIMIILGIWLYMRITGRGRTYSHHTNRAGNHVRFSQRDDFAKGSNRRKDVTDSGHDTTVHRHDSGAHWDDF
ncbi:hypothetical protein [Lacticaseibacillus songhuajiangensis]|uniref:hypothetical protein n=1 Tax=Lacticaseibacillus songhuajiangensis TaxID=1296539 RepID=UPI000F7BABF9|nr:hypothetical protein [Lacticaseibacillus songhuajiangensis]MCI1284368.1 hypothetical protein [Lacticaseibacillus songhuajiangensis]